MTYTPRAASVADRALSHLATLDIGAELTTSALAEAIDTPALNLIPNLDAAVKHGAVFRRQKDDHPRSPIFWSLTDHTKAKAAPVRMTLAAETAGRTLAQIAAATGPSIPVEKPEVRAAFAMRIALWSTGELVIERRRGEFAETITLPADETRQLVAYLDGVLLERGE